MPNEIINSGQVFWLWLNQEKNIVTKKCLHLTMCKEILIIRWHIQIFEVLMEGKQPHQGKTSINDKLIVGYNDIIWPIPMRVNN